MVVYVVRVRGMTAVVLHLGGCFLFSTGHHAATSQVFLVTSNFTHTPVCTPVQARQQHREINKLNVCASVS